MRVKGIRLIDFKRFHDLTIELSDRSTKIVALVGPNGSGKSSVFDGFEEHVAYHTSRPGKPETYYRKSASLQTPSVSAYQPNMNVSIKTDQTTAVARTSLYIRSAFRFTPRLGISNIRELPSAQADENRPHYLIDTDTRFTENYERLLGQFFGEVYGKNLSGKDWVDQKIETLNKILKSVLDIEISFLGNPVEKQGSLYFKKGLAARFPYENLSAGEKEVLDLVLDLYVKRDIYTNSIICIDEPELHLSTAIQRRLLIELEKLVPEGSQLWVATHSVGFLRALQTELRDKSTILDFSGIDFDCAVLLRPIAGRRADWSRIFATALEDLTGLLAPERLVYCEGRLDSSASGDEQGLDADVYNEVFQAPHGETQFVSSGGGGAVAKNALIAMRILNKAIKDVELLVLKDRDNKTDTERTAFLSQDRGNRMLTRHEVENFLFDKEVLKSYCMLKGTQFQETDYDALVTDICRQDLKPIQQKIMATTQTQEGIAAFKRSVAKALTPELATYAELEKCIF